ncbi:chromate efflux transporter [Mangrovibrevibacter kandeliae]|uniref:chromate efflux transporter n=1 Tax=Mangrovibrevibacter kandeliae TaxID=2968473 RepID=UPI002119B482|nr:chromate efflux transporter [Aurantimonas sp. CSK15Z-1]MCQ8783590.1 chromate efflux transporter [Aurantimonas sp. CSK15Z-1]
MTRSADEESLGPAAVPAVVPLRVAARLWARVALLSFGGPAGQIAVMHRLVVDEKRWVAEDRFLHALSFCMLLPGPEAQQLATYLGWLLHGVRGGVVAGTLFVLPGVAALLALSIVYALYGALGAVAALFYGLKAAVLAVVLQALVRVGARALGGPAAYAIASAAFLLIFFFAAPFPAIVVAAGLAGVLAAAAGDRTGRPADGAAPVVATGRDGLEWRDAAEPRSVAAVLRVGLICLVLWLLPVALLLALLGPDTVFSRIATFFATMAVVTFGGAYAVLAYVAQQAVATYGWLSPHEMLDGLGMAETTPGPLVMVLQFVGFMGAYRDPSALPPLLAGTLGGLLATWVTFLPSFLFVFVGAPFVEALRGNERLRAALSAITAAVVGVILNLAVWFALHVLFTATRPVRGFGLGFDAPFLASLDPAALVLSLAALVAVFRFRTGTIATFAGCALAGLALYGAGLIAPIR